jgi:hypothetical protein
MAELDIVGCKVQVPEWCLHLQTGGPLPPEPAGGWERWWDDNSDWLWLVIFAGALSFAWAILTEITTAQMRKRMT